ncbi:MAG: glycosyltransferase [Bacteroidales bacterium]|nr:glycosyltransferase [Bacteroidales bacterium]
MNKYKNNSLKNKLMSFYKLISNKPPYYNLKELYNLSIDIDCFFIDSSLNGSIAKFLFDKFPEKKIFTFFHNCEYDYSLQIVSKINPIIKFLHLWFVKQSEKNAILYSSSFSCLNNRDRKSLKKHYRKEPALIIPISMTDRVNNELLRNNNHIHNENEKLKLLFIGSNFPPNTLGLKWFLNEVFDKVNVDLTIIGNGMDREKDLLIKSNDIHIKGFVEDLTPYIFNADYMIYPILGGSGMKVKTCEALMYGKNILGTKEAFEGYDINIEKVGYECNSSEDFINRINYLRSVKFDSFNLYSRECFINNYASENVRAKYLNIFN